MQGRLVPVLIPGMGQLARTRPLAQSRLRWRARTAWPNGAGREGLGQVPTARVLRRLTLSSSSAGGAWIFEPLRGVGGFEATCLFKDKSPEGGYTGGGSTSTHDTSSVAPDMAAIHTLGRSDDHSSCADSTGNALPVVGAVGCD